MKILIYVGYQAVDFNPDTLKTIGLGGTEIACLNIANELIKFGHEVVVSGGVIPGHFNRVEWIPTKQCHEKYFNQFDVIISASYIHFALEFEGYHKAKTIFWAHNTDFHSWWRGNEIEDAVELLNSDKIDQVVCLTEWHKNQWQAKYGTSGIEVIGNGITPSSFIGRPEKIKNRFIFSSAPERGLIDLLENWSKILQIKPDATLEVFCPAYAIDDIDNSSKVKELLEQTGIILRGSVSQQDLHTAMLKAEYWPYLTSYEETYCITALEMQYAKVLPIVTTVAALNETVDSGIKLIQDETNWDVAVQILNTLGTELKAKTIDSAYQWSKMQTWSERSYDWNNLLNKICK